MPRAGILGWFPEWAIGSMESVKDYCAALVSDELAQIDLFYETYRN